jgi:hypothetical protein
MLHSKLISVAVQGQKSVFLMKKVDDHVGNAVGSTILGRLPCITSCNKDNWLYGIPTLS